MTINIEWMVKDLEYSAQDGGVIVVHWLCRASAESNASAITGSSNFQYDASDSKFVPIENLTEQVVLQWVFASLGDKKSAIEQQRKLIVENQINPKIQNGLPWKQTSND